MSMEICVLSDVRLSSVDEWQKAIDGEGFSLRLSYDKPLAQVGGFLPAYLNDKLTGFECRQRDLADITSAYPEIKFGRVWKCVLVFIWGGDFNEMQAAWMAATAYARATGGIIFDEEQGQLYDAAQAAQTVHEIVREIPNLKAMIRDLTRR
jgi:hypothetical protein